MKKSKKNLNTCFVMGLFCLLLVVAHDVVVGLEAVVAVDYDEDVEGLVVIHQSY